MGPAEVGDVGDAVFVAGEMGLAAGQVLVQRCVGFVREAAVAFDGDGVFVGGEDFEVDALADQRADAGGVEDEPLRGLPAGARFGGQQAAGFSAR